MVSLSRWPAGGHGFNPRNRKARECNAGDVLIIRFRRITLDDHRSCETPFDVERNIAIHQLCAFRTPGALVGLVADTEIENLVTSLGSLLDHQVKQQLVGADISSDFLIDRAELTGHVPVLDGQAGDRDDFTGVLAASQFDPVQLKARLALGVARCREMAKESPDSGIGEHIWQTLGCQPRGLLCKERIEQPQCFRIRIAGKVIVATHRFNPTFRDPEFLAAAFAVDLCQNRIEIRKQRQLKAGVLMKHPRQCRKRHSVGCLRRHLVKQHDVGCKTGPRQCRSELAAWDFLAGRFAFCVDQSCVFV